MSHMHFVLHMTGYTLIRKALVWGSLFLVAVTLWTLFAIGDFRNLDPFKVAKSPVAKGSIRLLVLKTSYPKRVLSRSTCIWYYI